MAEETGQRIFSITRPVRAFENHDEFISTVAVFPDGLRMVTGSGDNTLRLWDVEEGVVLKKMKGHRRGVEAVAVSGDGKLIASGDLCGELIAWDGESGEPATQALEAHSRSIYSLDFSPDGTILATGSSDKTTRFWSTETWQLQGNPINCVARVYCVRYSPSGELLAIATDLQIQIYNPCTGEFIANFDGHARVISPDPPKNISLVWTPDGMRILSAGDTHDPTIREWDPLTGKQVGHPWIGHTSIINAIAMNSAGTLVASACGDNHVRLWQVLDARTIAIFQHSNWVYCVAFSTDGKHILSGGQDKKILQWKVPDDPLRKVPDDPLRKVPDDPLGKQETNQTVIQGEIPDQDYDYTQDTGFFQGMNNYRHISQPRPRRRMPFFKRLRLAVANTTRSTAPPAPTTLSPVAPIPFQARLQQLLTWRHVHADHAAPPVVEVPCTKGKEQCPRQSTSSRRRPPVVEVAAVRDKKPLYVARRHKPKSMQQQQQTQSQSQTQASASQTEPAAASASTTPPAPDTSNTVPGAPTARSLPLWARVVLFLCCAPTTNTNAH